NYIKNEDLSNSKNLLPSSYHQERLWFIDKFESGNLYEAGPLYHNVPLVIDFEGKVNFELLERSIQVVIQSHEILRTQIVSINDIPYQRIVEGFSFALGKEDLQRQDQEVSKL